MKKLDEEDFLLPEEFNLVGVVRVADKPHPLKHKVSSCNKGTAKIIQFKAVQ